MDKSKQPPLPEKTGSARPKPQTEQPEPKFVRGTIEPTTKK